MGGAVGAEYTLCVRQLGWELLLQGTNSPSRQGGSTHQVTTVVAFGRATSLLSALPSLTCSLPHMKPVPSSSTMATVRTLRVTAW